MSRRLVLDPDAEQDLDTIFDYLAQNNPATAARYIREKAVPRYQQQDKPHRRKGKRYGGGNEMQPTATTMTSGALTWLIV
jgi:plasmid stabilization system protein ParE